MVSTPPVPSPDDAYDEPLESVAPEVALGLVSALGAGLAVAVGTPRMAPSLSFFGAGVATVAGYAWWQR